MNDNIPVLAVVGPTASGKTALAVELAKRLHGEVIGADSMQVYQKMQIATAKPSEMEMQGVPHHLIGFLSPCEPFNVVQYLELAGACIREIHRRGRLPVLCGGTGLFVDSLLQNIQFVPMPTDEALREALRKRSETEGMERLLEELKEVDPESAARLHPNNRGRIIRALEVYYATGKPLSVWNALSKAQPSPYDSLILGIGFRDREVLYERINRRVDRMMEQGLLEEAEEVLAMEELPTARQAIGYKELAPYFKGECTLDEALERLRRETRRYAKRQLTWFRRNQNVHWLWADELSEEELIRAALSLIQEAFKR